LTTEPNAVAFVQRTEDARSFHINPLEEIIVKIPSEQTNDALCIVEHRSGPNAAPPLHLHRNEDEIFEILEGRFRFWLDGEIVEASAGATVVAPRRVPHTWINMGGTPGRMTVPFIPGGIDGFFHNMENIPHTDPRALIVSEQYGILYLGPPMELSSGPCGL
jgi:mannose-6-phosphate isomerase-like protein (cupin superfamily)